MDEPGTWLLLFGVAVLFAGLFMLVCFEAVRMSGGKLKFLEEVNPGLYEKLEDIFPLKEDRLYAGRCCAVICCIASGICLCKWGIAIGLGPQNWWKQVWRPAVILAVVWAVLELFHTLMSLTFSARLLCFASCFLKYISYVLCFWCFPMGALSRRFAKWRHSMVEEGGGEGPTVEDEILSLVEGETISEQSQAAVSDLEDDEKRMIAGALALDEISVRRIMTPRVEIVGVAYETGMDVAEFVQDARHAIVQSGHSRIPVYTDTIDNVIGVVYSKDLLDEAKSSDISKVFHRDPLFIPLTKNIGDLLEEFRQNKIHLAVVVDEYGGTAGIVTFEDVLETLVGDIKDEYDAAEGSLELQEVKKGVYQGDARTPVALINKLLDVEIPEDKEYDTIGGYISACTGRIPSQGETIDTDILRITVKKADHRRVIEVELSAKTEPET